MRWWAADKIQDGLVEALVERWKWACTFGEGKPWQKTSSCSGRPKQTACIDSVFLERMNTLTLMYFERVRHRLAILMDAALLNNNLDLASLMTAEQLERGASKRNETILATTVTSGDEELDRLMLKETRKELAKTWVRGTFSLRGLQPGSVISRRLPLVQPNKTRMIDDNLYRSSFTMYDWTFVSNRASWIVLLEWWGPETGVANTSRQETSCAILASEVKCNHSRGETRCLPIGGQWLSVLVAGCFFDWIWTCFGKVGAIPRVQVGIGASMKSGPPWFNHFTYHLVEGTRTKWATDKTKWEDKREEFGLQS